MVIHSETKWTNFIRPRTRWTLKNAVKCKIVCYLIMMFAVGLFPDFSKCIAAVAFLFKPFRHIFRIQYANIVYRIFTKKSSLNLNNKIQTRQTSSLSDGSMSLALCKFSLDVITSNCVCCRRRWSLWCHNSQMTSRSCPTPKLLCSLIACMTKSTSSSNCKRIFLTEFSNKTDCNDNSKMS